MSVGLRRKVSTALVSCSGAALLALATLVLWSQTPPSGAQATEAPPHSAALDDAIIAAAKRHGVPESLLRRIIMRESKYNPLARNRKFWGLMQISYPTAKSMGFRGSPRELLDPVVNLRYAVPYLANAFVISGKQEEAAVRLYAAGYYNTARSRGLLSALRTADSAPLSGFEQQPVLTANAVAQPPQSVGIFGALFGPGSSMQTEPQPQQVATAEAPGAAPTATAQASAAPAGTFDGPGTAMVAGKDGGLAPPKKWTRDGGMSVVARGEQGLDQIASREKTAEASTSKSRRRSHKLTAFAALDLPASSAQAYATSPAQDPRFFAAPSQAAIAQATAAPTAPAAQPVADQQSRPQVVAADDEPATETKKPAKRSRVHQARKRKAADTKEARAEKGSGKSESAPAAQTTTQ